MDHYDTTMSIPNLFLAIIFDMQKLIWIYTLKNEELFLQIHKASC